MAADIRKAAPNTFMTFAMPMNVAKSSYEVLNACFNAMELGADSIMCGGWSLDFVEVAAKSGSNELASVSFFFPASSS